MLLKDTLKAADHTCDFLAASSALLEDVYLFKVLSACVTLIWRLFTCSGNLSSSVRVFLEMETISSWAGPVLSFFFLVWEVVVAEVEPVAVSACLLLMAPWLGVLTGAWPGWGTG